MKLFDKNKIKESVKFKRITYAILNFYACLKRLLEIMNIFFNKWLATITVFGVLVPLTLTLISYNNRISEQDKENLERNTRLNNLFVLETCLNKKNAEVIKTGRDGEQYVFNVPYYSTVFYRNNWPDLMTIIESKELDPAKLYDMIMLMENQNRMLDNNYFRPSNDLSMTAEKLLVILDELNFPACR